MDLLEHYTNLWNTSSAQFEKGVFELDPLLDAEEDRRFGITLLARPSESVKEAIAGFLDALLTIEPALYAYPPSDMHVTVMSIISCYAGFELSDIKVNAYESLLTEVVQDVKPFEITFKGITASPSSIMVQGFPKGETLHVLRDRIRERFKSSPLRQSIDSRYTIRTAHSSVARFREPPQRQQELLQKLSAYRNFVFGIFKVEALELVYNDWYQRQNRVKILKKFELG